MPSTALSPSDLIREPTWAHISPMRAPTRRPTTSEESPAFIEPHTLQCGFKAYTPTRSRLRLTGEPGDQRPTSRLSGSSRLLRGNWTLIRSNSGAETDRKRGGEGKSV